MPCPCKAEFERALVEMTEAQKPKASDVKARIEGYGLNLRTGEERPALVAVVTYQTPKAKGGGMRTVTERMQAVATFCPFCGQRFPDATA